MQPLKHRQAALPKMGLDHAAVDDDLSRTRCVGCESRTFTKRVGLAAWSEVVLARSLTSSYSPQTRLTTEGSQRTDVTFRLPVQLFSFCKLQADLCKFLTSVCILHLLSRCSRLNCSASPSMLGALADASFPGSVQTCAAHLHRSGPLQARLRIDLQASRLMPSYSQLTSQGPREGTPRPSPARQNSARPTAHSQHSNSRSPRALGPVRGPKSDGQHTTKASST